MVCHNELLSALLPAPFGLLLLWSFLSLKFCAVGNRWDKPSGQNPQNSQETIFLSKFGSAFPGDPFPAFSLLSICERRMVYSLVISSIVRLSHDSLANRLILMNSRIA